MNSHALLTSTLLLVNGTLMAGIYALAKVAGHGGITPLGVLAWQVLFAAFAIGLIAAARGEWPALSLRTVRYAAIAGVLGVTAPSLVTFTALAHVPAGLIGVISALSPVFTYGIALALGVERVHPWRAAGIALGFAGVLAVVLPSGALPNPSALSWVLVALAGPALLAGGNVFRSRAWPAGVTPLGAAALMLVLQAIVLVPVAVAVDAFEAPRALFRPSDLALLGAGALTAAFYLGAFELQKRGGPVVVGQLGFVMTVASLAIGVAAFGERYPLTAFAAVAVVLAGVALVNRPVAPASKGA